MQTDQGDKVYWVAADKSVVRVPYDSEESSIAPEADTYSTGPAQVGWAVIRGRSTRS